MQASSLNWFAQPAPTCSVTATAAEVVALLGPCLSAQAHRPLVALDERNCPLGQVDCAALLQRLLQVGNDFALRDCVQALPVVRHDLPLSEFWLLWQQQPEPFWALVNAEGTFVGLLDGFSLLHTWYLRWGGEPVSARFSLGNDSQPLPTPQLPTLQPLLHLVECLPLPALLTTRSGEAVKVNRLWQEQLGEVRPDAMPVPPAETESSTGSTCMLLPSGSPYSPAIYQCSSTDGSEHTWQLIQAPLLAGNLRLVLAQDITEQRQVARELEARNADLVQLNRVKDDFLSCISHELKTPLTSVLGMASLLVEESFGSLNERQKRYATLIHQSGRHLMAVINDILDLAKVETGQLELLPEAIDLAEVCERSFEQTRRLFQHRGQESWTEGSVGIQFSLSIDPDLDRLIGDEFRLRQMLVNLLSNAFKFTPPPGRVSLSVRRWQSWIAFSVSDTGIGIPIDKQHLVFQKFQQLESPMTRRFEGTGMGLVLTQRLARLHGGDVTFVSQEGKGSQFTLLLPPHPPLKLPPGQGLVRQVTPGPVQGAGLQALGSCLALIIEAVPTELNALAERLAPMGYQVVVARSGLEALEKARRLRPGLILLSPFLSGLSGWDVLALLKQQSETREIPVVVLASLAERRQALAAGADGFLTQPIQPGELRRLLLELESEAPVSAAPQSLTVLRLGSTDCLRHEETPQLAELLHACGYRLLEADGLEQGELLARIWQPDVVLLDSLEPEPAAALRALSQMTVLASLPLVYLASSFAAPAPIAGLNLRILPLEPSGHSPAAEAVLQALQSVVGYTASPLVLLGDFGEPPISNASATLPLHQPDLPGRSALLAHYLRTAGYRVLLTQNPDDLLRQIKAGNGNLLLLLLRYRSPELLSAALELAQYLHLEPRSNLPLVVLDDRQRHQNLLECVLFDAQGSAAAVYRAPEQANGAEPDPLYDSLRAAHALALPSSVSMAELMQILRHCLAQEPLSASTPGQRPAG